MTRHHRLLAPPGRSPYSPDRRNFLRGMSLGALALGGGALAGCGIESAKQTEESCESEDLSATEKEIVFSNWPLYIDPINAKNVSTLEMFERQSGIDVQYTTDVNDNAEFFGKVRNQLAECESTGRDVFVLTDYMAARMVSLGWIQELDKSNLPLVQSNTIPSLMTPAWDPQRRYGVPWQSGLTGIAYNADLVPEVGSFEELLTRPDLKGRVTLLSEMQDTMIFMLLLVGANPENFTQDEFGAALERLQAAVDAEQIRAFTGNDYAQDLAKGNIAACEAWSGDVIQLQFENPKIKFVAPEEGLSLWSDNMIIPNKATHKANVEKMMNFYYDPAIAAKLAAWVNYICPVQGAREEMEKIDPSLANNQLIFPDDEFLSKTYGFMELSIEEDQNLQSQFSEVIGG